MGQFDDTMKLLVGENPQALVSFLLNGALYKGVVDRELKTRTIHADLLYYVEWNNELIILHIEFQRRRAGNMPRRVWEYNALANIMTGKPVYSVVIYLVELPSITEPVYKTSFRNGHTVQWFAFDQLKLWELSPEVFEQPQLVGLLPLLPLTKNGQNRETVERMINEMQQAGKQDLLWLGKAVAGLVLKSGKDKRWLKERFQDMFDILKDSWVYQETVEEGMKEGLKRGLEQGLEQGMERNLIQFVEIRFPTLLDQAKQMLEQKTSSEHLQLMLNGLYSANTVEEAKNTLQMDKKSKK